MQIEACTSFSFSRVRSVTTTPSSDDIANVTEVVVFFLGVRAMPTCFVRQRTIFSLSPLSLFVTPQFAMDEPITYCSEYCIVQTKGELSSFQKLPYLYRYSLALRWFSWLSYVYLQVQLLKHVSDSNQKADARLWLILCAEILLNAQQIILALNALFPVFIVPNQKARPRMRLEGDKAPNVVVMIPCCGEMPKILLNTIRAAAAQDYPTSQFRVYVLDDGNDPLLKRGVEEIQFELGDSRLRYLCRRSNSFFKAGNLEFGIKEVVKEDAPEFIASLDADMIPDKQWLRRVIPHLLLDSRVGLACPPQVYVSCRGVRLIVN